MCILVVENPPSHGGAVKYGTFVLVTIDIASSLEGVTDKVAIQAAEALPRARCLAWINSFTSRFGSPLSYFIFMLAERGLPGAPRSFAAVPISPSLPHPDTGRAAAVPSRPFPWSDCYLHTLRDFTAPISRLYRNPAAEFFLDRSQKEHVLISEMEDVEATEDERQAAMRAAGYGVRSGIRVIDRGSHGPVIFEGDSASDSQASSRRSVSEGSASGDADRASDAASMGDPALPRPSSVHVPAAERPTAVELEPHAEGQGIVLYVEATSILDPSDEFGTVEDFLSVARRLHEIEAERQERALTARCARVSVAKTEAWLQGVPAAGD